MPEDVENEPEPENTEDAGMGEDTNSEARDCESGHYLQKSFDEKFPHAEDRRKSKKNHMNVTVEAARGLCGARGWTGGQRGQDYAPKGQNPCSRRNARSPPRTTKKGRRTNPTLRGAYGRHEPTSLPKASMSKVSG